MGERITRVMGIVNGTTNYILTRMTEAGASYADALAEAQALGFAEADPTADVEGYDAGAKAAIIASIAFGVAITADDVHHEGITGITEVDIAFAGKMGYVVKLLAVAEQTDSRRGRRAGAPGDGPARAPAGRRARELQRRSSWRARRSATSCSTAAAPAARPPPARSSATSSTPPSTGTRARTRRSASSREAVLRPIDDAESAYYLNLEVLDRPGVLAQVAGVFGDNGVSIRSMEQEGLGDEARLIFITHRARHADVQATLAALGALEAVDRIGSVAPRPRRRPVKYVSTRGDRAGARASATCCSPAWRPTAGSTSPRSGRTSPPRCGRRCGPTTPSPST